MLEEAMSTLHDVDISFWGKLHFLSNNSVVQKFLLRDFRIVLDGSNTQYNGTTWEFSFHISQCNAFYCLTMKEMTWQKTMH